MKKVFLIAACFISMMVYADIPQDILKQAESGNAEAQYAIGLRYFEGKEVSANANAAAEWYTKAAIQGHPKAQFRLGALYGEGLGVAKSDQHSLEWLTKAATNGESEAQFALGYIYEDGTVAAKNYKTAVEWYRKAANQGHVDAQYNLGLMYGRGNGVPQSHNEAVNWISKAADQGDAQAQHTLGDVIVRNGAPKDLIVAYALYKLASETDIEAEKSLQSLEVKMAAKDVKTALSLVKEMQKPQNLLKAMRSYQSGALVISPTVSHSLTTDKSKEAAVHKLLLFVQMEQSWNMLVANFRSTGLTQFELLSLDRFCENYLKYADVKPEIIKAYMSTYTEAEIAAFADFISTPSGVSVMKKLTDAISAGADATNLEEVVFKNGLSEQERKDFLQFYQSKIWKSMGEKSGVLGEKFLVIINGIATSHAAELKKL